MRLGAAGAGKKGGKGGSSKEEGKDKEAGGSSKGKKAGGEERVASLTVRRFYRPEDISKDHAYEATSYHEVRGYGG